MRLAFALKNARWRNADRSNSASSSRFSRRSRFRLNSAVTPRLSLYAASSVRSSLRRSTPRMRPPAGPMARANPAQKRRRLRRMEVADRRSGKERDATHAPGRRRQMHVARVVGAHRRDRDVGVQAIAAQWRRDSAARPRCRWGRTRPVRGARRATGGSSRPPRSRTPRACIASPRARRARRRTREESTARYA